MLEPEELEAAGQRIELLSGMDLIGRTIGEAVRSSYRPPEALRTRHRKKLPVVGLLDILRSRAMRQGNIPKFFAEQAMKHGSVFEINAGGRKLVVLASQELNLWTGKKGRLLLRTRDYLEGFQQEWGTARSIASMDGADHFRMRKAMRDGVSRVVVEDRIHDVFALARETFSSWKINSVIPVEKSCQRLIGAQIADLSLSFVPSHELLDDRIPRTSGTCVRHYAEIHVAYAADEEIQTKRTRSVCADSCNTYSGAARGQAARPGRRSAGTASIGPAVPAGD